MNTKAILLGASLCFLSHAQSASRNNISLAMEILTTKYYTATTPQETALCGYVTAPGEQTPLDKVLNDIVTVETQRESLDAQRKAFSSLKKDLVSDSPEFKSLNKQISDNTREDNFLIAARKYLDHTEERLNKHYYSKTEPEDKDFSYDLLIAAREKQTKTRLLLAHQDLMATSTIIIILLLLQESDLLTFENLKEVLSIIKAHLEV